MLFLPAVAEGRGADPSRQHSHKDREPQPVCASFHQPSRGDRDTKQGNLTSLFSVFVLLCSAYCSTELKSHAGCLFPPQIRQQNRQDAKTAGPQSQVLASVITGDSPPVNCSGYLSIMSRFLFKAVIF